MDMNITVVYNNVEYSKELTCDWGMACVVKGFDKTILFDTGGDGSVLLSNMKKMDIAPEDIEIVFLSHIHTDHTGGLWKFLEVNPRVTVYLPSSFPGDFKHGIIKRGAQFVDVESPIEIFQDVFSTGELGTWIKEQSLILKTVHGLIIITGCSHPGIVTIAQRAIQICHDKIYLITGGFHLGSVAKSEIENIINQLKELGVKNIAPGHCTGEKAMLHFREAWGENYIESGCGAIIKIPATTFF